ncbi:photosystem II reaction center protein Ycf12/Psb30 [Prochlorothrix hollandica]|nr:photosystem II reaction center protein Ycf12 [Prochlorothrix hollandica]
MMPVLGAINFEVIVQLGVLGAIILAGPIVIFLASTQQS